MKIKVIGKVKGTGKTSGKPFNAAIYLAPVFNGEGEESRRLFLSDEVFASVQVGKEYVAEFGPTGWLDSFKPA